MVFQHFLLFLICDRIILVMAELERPKNIKYVDVQSKLRDPGQGISVKCNPYGPAMTNLVAFLNSFGTAPHNPSTSFHQEVIFVFKEQPALTGGRLGRWIRLTTFGGGEQNGYYIEIFDDIMPNKINPDWGANDAATYPNRVLAITLTKNNQDWRIDTISFGLKKELVNECLRDLISDLSGLPELVKPSGAVIQDSQRKIESELRELLTLLQRLPV